jgi:uncharacterized metal-binding protein YceD (DUF177 family)
MPDGGLKSEKDGLNVFVLILFAVTMQCLRTNTPTKKTKRLALNQKFLP